MSSPCDKRSRREPRFSARVAFSCFSCVLALLGCGRASDDIAVPAEEPRVRAVGPIPGIGERISEKNPYADDEIAITEGRRLFVQFNCSGCHGGRAGGGMGPSLRDQDWIYGDSDEHVYGSIAEGRAHGMSAWGTKVPPEQIWKLVSYIKSLRTTREPQAPS